MRTAPHHIHALVAIAALLAVATTAGAQEGAVLNASAPDCRAVLETLNPPVSRSPEEVGAALADLGPTAVPHLLVLFRSNPEPARRQAVAAALERISGGDRERLLLAVAAGQNDLLARATALDLLEETAGLAHVPDLVTLLRAPEREVRKGAERAIVAALGRVPEGSLREPLGRLLASAPLHVRMGLTECAILTSRPEILPTLAEQMGRDRLLDMLILCGLARMPAGAECEAMVSVARRYLEDVDPAVRRQAALGLGRLHDPESAGRLVALLSDPDDGVRGNAWHALREMTGVEFPPEPKRWQVWYDAERRFWDGEGRRLLDVIESGTEAEVVDAMRLLALHPLYRDLVAKRFAAFLEDGRAGVRTVAEAVVGVPAGGGGAAGAAESRAADAFAWFEQRPTSQVPVRTIGAPEPPEDAGGGSLVSLIVGGGIFLGLALRLAGVSSAGRSKSRRRSTAGPVTVVVRHRWAKDTPKQTAVP